MVVPSASGRPPRSRAGPGGSHWETDARSRPDRSFDVALTDLRTHVGAVDNRRDLGLGITRTQGRGHASGRCGRWPIPDSRRPREIDTRSRLSMTPRSERGTSTTVNPYCDAASSTTVLSRRSSIGRHAAAQPMPADRGPTGSGPTRLFRNAESSRCMFSSVSAPRNAHRRRGAPPRRRRRGADRSQQRACAGDIFASSMATLAGRRVPTPHLGSDEREDGRADRRTAGATAASTSAWVSGLATISLMPRASLQHQRRISSPRPGA